MNLFSLPADEKRVVLHAQVPENTFAWGDPEMINLVIRNLLHNAIKYSNPGTRVTIEVAEEAKKIRIRIIDEGVGIPQNHLALLFSLASGATTNGTSGEKGSGLGLVVCREFIERHGSTITVESEVNKGSVFSFYLKTGNQ
jgi:signal transduction histidine kinase